jgi:hypothetical protein
MGQIDGQVRIGGKVPIQYKIDHPIDPYMHPLGQNMLSFHCNKISSVITDEPFPVCYFKGKAAMK